MGGRRYIFPESRFVSSLDSLRWTVVAREAIFDQLKVDLQEDCLITRVPIEEVYEYLGKSDVVLVEVDNSNSSFDFDIASSRGLAVSFLLRSYTEGKLWGVCRFGLHKRVFKKLAAVGRWWELRADKGRAYEVLRKLLNRVSDGVAELDALDEVRWANTSLKRALPQVDWDNARLEGIVEPEDQVRLRALREQHSEGIVVPFAVRLLNGQSVELDPSPWYDEEGKFQGTSLVFRQVHSSEEQESRANELFCLYSLAAAIGQTTSIEEALTVAIERTTELLGLPAGGGSLETALGILTKELSSTGEIPRAVNDFFSSLRLKYPEGKRALVERAVDQGSDLAKNGFHGYAVVPLESEKKRIGMLWFLTRESGKFPRETVSLLISMAHQLSMTIENHVYAQTRLNAELEKRTFYRDALRAVTRGKLVLCELDEVDKAWIEAGSEKGQLQIKEAVDVPKARHFIEESIGDTGLSSEKVADAALCVTEAVGNVVKHAEYGAVAVRVSESAVTIRIEDVGPGIDFTHLPNAVLAAGFSTAPSLGMGYSILLEMMDRVYLSTSSKGTTILLEVQKQESDPLAAFAHLMLDDF